MLLATSPSVKELPALAVIHGLVSLSDVVLSGVAVVELTGICREDMSRGARLSEGLGECIIELLVLLMAAA